MWRRVAERARIRKLTSIEREGEDAVLTRNLVSAVMYDSRSGEPTMSDADADSFAGDIEAELERQQAEEAAPPPPQAASSSQSSAASPLSDYEIQRLLNIARNQLVLKGLGLASLGPPAKSSKASAREAYPPSRSNAAPSRRSNMERKAVNYAGGDDSEDDSTSEDEACGVQESENPSGSAPAQN